MDVMRPGSNRNTVGNDIRDSDRGRTAMRRWCEGIAHGLKPADAQWKNEQ